MNVLIACEFSGVVREAFRKKGHNAWSCDLLPALDNSEYHFQQDIFELLENTKSEVRRTWDLIIAHPPCTYLCNSGVRWLHIQKEYKKEYHDWDCGHFNGWSPELRKEVERFDKRWDNLNEAVNFFYKLFDLDVPKLCIENPIPHKYAELPSYTQIVHPWQFGHGERKPTCLWLKGLPKLKPTNIVEGREQRIWRLPPSKDRSKLRSITYQGIADAMAEQWG